MVKSLGDYNKEKSSSSDIQNIKWVKKNPSEPQKSKNKKKVKKFPPSNIIYSNKNNIQPPEEKIFKITKRFDKTKKDTLDKKSQKSSLGNSKIKPGFKRPGR